MKRKFFHAKDVLASAHVEIMPCADSFDWMLKGCLRATDPKEKPRGMYFLTRNFPPTPLGMASALEHAASAIRDGVRKKSKGRK